MKTEPWHRRREPAMPAGYDSVPDWPAKAAARPGLAAHTASQRLIGLIEGLKAAPMPTGNANSTNIRRHQARINSVKSETSWRTRVDP